MSSGSQNQKVQHWSFNLNIHKWRRRENTTSEHEGTPLPPTAQRLISFTVTFAWLWEAQIHVITQHTCTELLPYANHCTGPCGSNSGQKNLSSWAKGIYVEQEWSISGKKKKLWATSFKIFYENHVPVDIQGKSPSPIEWKMSTFYLTHISFQITMSKSFGFSSVRNCHPTNHMTSLHFFALS